MESELKMNKQEARKEAKNTCPSCGGTNVVHDISKEDGNIEVAILRCKSCFHWW